LVAGALIEAGGMRVALVQQVLTNGECVQGGVKERRGEERMRYQANYKVNSVVNVSACEKKKKKKKWQDERERCVGVEHGG
jgi:hypothetical protein